MEGQVFTEHVVCLCEEVVEVSYDSLLVEHWVVDARCVCRWTEDEVNGRLEVKMKEAFEVLWDTSVRKDIPLRTAAFVVSLERVTKATLERGFQ